MASGCFDLLAGDYDRTWTNSAAGRLQRDAVWRQIARLFRAGDHVLDLGCGTGEDAEHLIRHGVRVRAMDASPEMVRLARNRGVNAEVGTIEKIHDLEGAFDGVFSNFGALNCVEDLALLRSPLARLVTSGGHLALCLMGRFCLMESLHFLRQRRFRKASRRWLGRTCIEKLGMHVFYPTAREMERAMAPEFRFVRRTGIGLAVPPSCISGLSAASLTVRNRIDERVAHWPLLRAMADHELFIFIRKQH